MKLSFAFLIAGLIFSLGCGGDELIMSDFSQTEELVRKAPGESLTDAIEVKYSEKFSTSAVGWSKIAGPGLLEVTSGVFMHTTMGSSVWCEYAYTVRTFASGRYQLDIFVVDDAVNTAFVWRSPDTSIVTPNGGAYQATFNAGGHFVLEKFDSLGRTTLLDVPDSFLGLNRLVIDDRGKSVTVSINGVNYGTIDVTHLTRARSGYMVLIGGDLGHGDYFDNIKISTPSSGY